MTEKKKRPFDVYAVEEFGNGNGTVTRRRKLAGTTWAVSADKARANVEYRNRGKAIYGGEDEYDLGGDSYYRVWYEAEEA